MTAVDIPYAVTLDQEDGSNHISITSRPVVLCCVVALSAWPRDLLLNFIKWLTGDDKVFERC